tara:strand:- start:2218 stop:2781 length:564 start_codon:yes stop_codon:yes gene_type:complete
MKTISKFSELEKIILSWAETTNIVIGLDGGSGSGKTTLANRLSENCESISYINIDDYTNSVNSDFFIIELNKSTPEQIIEQYINTQNLSKIKTLIQKNCKKILIIDGNFIFHPKSLNLLLDKRIYINTKNSSKALKRQTREKNLWKNEYDQTESDKFAAYFECAFNYYVEKYNPVEKADLTIDEYLI